MSASHHRKSGGSVSLRIPHSALRISEGFSLIEIMLTVTLLAVIILGLVAMFNQTRRAFTSSLTQVDVLESGRSAADLVTRELEQASAANSYSLTNFYVDSPVINTPYAQMVQPLLLAPDQQVNNLQRVCFLTRNNLQWSFIGYELLPLPGVPNNPYQAGMGTLYRYSVTGIALTNVPFLAANFSEFLANSAQVSTNFSRLIDGVVDFRIRVMDTNGVMFPLTNNYVVGQPRNLWVLNQTNFTISDQQATFTSNALPAYVEVELGVLEDRALAHYQALVPAGTGPGTGAWNYLTNHAGQVHIFRQRITIRNANPAAF